MIHLEDELESIKKQLGDSKMEIHSFQIIASKNAQEMQKILKELKDLDLNKNYEAPFETIIRLIGCVNQRIIPNVEKSLAIMEHLKSQLSPLVEKINSIENGLHKIRTG